MLIVFQPILFLNRNLHKNRHFSINAALYSSFYPPACFKKKKLSIVKLPIWILPRIRQFCSFLLYYYWKERICHELRFKERDCHA